MSDEPHKNVHEMLDEAIEANSSRSWGGAVYDPRQEIHEETKRIRELLDRLIRPPDPPAGDDSIYRLLKCAEARGWRIIIEPMVSKESDREA
jgi:hypothetical protein